jgi:hypothetical protein
MIDRFLYYILGEGGGLLSVVISVRRRTDNYWILDRAPERLPPSCQN